jgi:probable rRNA maturation factor
MRPHSEAIEVEVIGDALSSDETERLCFAALRAVGIRCGHLAVEFVDAERIAELNAEYRGKNRPTDVLSFPIDGDDGDRSNSSLATDDQSPPVELGDVIICPEYTHNLSEAVVHGVLHLAGMDHETDNGEMLALQAQILSQNVEELD